MPPPTRASRASRDTMSIAGPRPLSICHLAVLFILIIVCRLLLVSGLDRPYYVGVRPAPRTGLQSLLSPMVFDALFHGFRPACPAAPERTFKPLLPAYKTTFTNSPHSGIFHAK